MSDCLFCKICAGELPSEQIYADDDMIVIKDIYPKAPVHLLVIPRRHIDSLATVTEADRELMAKLIMKVPEIAKSQGLEKGFRTIVNTGADGGQEIDHIHIHILGGGGKLPFA